MSAKRRGSDKVTLKIPRPLYGRLRDLIADTGFHSVTEFAVFVLRDIASPPERTSSPGGDLTESEVEAVRRRLKKLGYL
jgi:hypothetical protein